MEINLVNQIVNFIKNKKALYEIDGDVITISKGFFDIYIQLEKSNQSENYDFFQLWITNEGDWNKVYSDEFDINHQVDSLEGTIENAFEKVDEINKQVKKIAKLFNDIQNIVNEYHIPLDVLDELYKDMEFED